MKDKNKFVTHERVIVCVADLLQGRLEKIKHKPGYTNKDITSDGGTTRAYSKILFRMIELMILDVIAGDVVYFDRRRKSRLYVDYKPATERMILGEGLDKTNRVIDEEIDFTITRYRVPIIAFDPGYAQANPCEVRIPPYLYNKLIKAVNSGKRYSKSPKDFYYNK